MFSTEVTTAPTVGAVTLTEAKSHLGFTADEIEFDSIIGVFLMAATAAAQVFIGAKLMRQTLKLRATGFPKGGFDLPVYPVHAIDAVAYRDTNGDAQTLTGAGVHYWSSIVGRYPWIAPAQTWPDTQEGNPEAVTVTCEVGYADAAEVPADIKGAVLMMVSEMFDHRGESTTGQTLAANIRTVESLLAPHRRMVIK